jgi:hypothetical protein
MARARIAILRAVTTVYSLFVILYLHFRYRSTRVLRNRNRTVLRIKKARSRLSIRPREKLSKWKEREIKFTNSERRGCRLRERPNWFIIIVMRRTTALPKKAPA